MRRTSLFDKPMKSAEAEAAEGEGDGMSAAERKKAESKRKKAEAKAKAEAEAKAAADKEAAKATGGGGKNKKGGNQKEKPVDEDPDGAALAAVDDPLEKASGFLRTLQAHAPNDLRTHTLACELAMRKKRYLLAVKALRKARSLPGGAESPAVHTAMIKFLHAVSNETSLNPTISKVIEENREGIGAPKGKSLAALNAAYGARRRLERRRRLRSRRCSFWSSLLRRRTRSPSLRVVDVSSMSLTLAKETHTLLAKVFKDESAASAFKAKALQRFPVCGHFGGTTPKLIEGPTLPNAQTAPTSAP